LIALVESEGTRPALLPAGPVPERWNVKSVFVETADGPAIGWTGLFAFVGLQFCIKPVSKVGLEAVPVPVNLL